MASRIRNRSSFSTDSFARVTLLPYKVRLMLASTTISDITTITSMRVNPRALNRITRNPDRPTIALLPVSVLCAIQPGALALRKHVEHVLATPRCGVRFVLIRTKTPVGAVGHRVDRNMSQIFELSAGRVVGHRDAIHQHVQIRWVPFVFRPQLGGRNLAGVDRILELVNRGTHFTQVAAQL